MEEVTLNEKDRLFVIPCGKGYTCLGFDVLDKRARALAVELGHSWQEGIGTIKAYAGYQIMLALADERSAKTGWRSSSELTPQLVGLEGKRVEVVDAHGEKRRFNVGKSTGWIPCHLEIHNARSHGGPAVMGAPFKSVRVIR